MTVYLSLWFILWQRLRLRDCNICLFGLFYYYPLHASLIERECDEVA